MGSHAARLPASRDAAAAARAPLPTFSTPHEASPTRVPASAASAAAVPAAHGTSPFRVLLTRLATRVGLLPSVHMTVSAPPSVLPLAEVLRRALSAPGLRATKGYGALLLLYLMRFHSLRTALRQLLLWGGAAFALCANFHLSLDPPTCVKGLTVGVSRLVLVFTALRILRHDDGLAPFYIGLAMRLVPVAMFFFFKGVYAATRRTRDMLWGAPPLLPPTAPRACGEDGEGMAVGGGSCCICLEGGCDYTTACGHVYHAACLARWVQRSARCPLCHEPVRAGGGGDGTAGASGWCVPLERFFLLDFERWTQWHMLCGDWWYERVV